ncbi:MAG: LysR substrate-binding domain-containing protein [Armatimonadota bacterium]
MIPLVPLRTFHLVVVHQSFNKAARHLGITQPAVTQQIHRLERAIGLRLFHRDGRRLVLAEAGQTLEVFAQRIFHLADAARDALEGVSGLQTGHLKVGASRTAGAYYVSDLLDRFKKRYPGVLVSLSVGNSQTILAGILDFTLHAGLIAGRPNTPQLVPRALIRDRMLVILPPRHALARKPTLSIKDLRGFPLVLREPGSTTRELVERAFRAHGVVVDPSMELESNEAIKSAVADGIGVAIMAHAAVAQDLATGRLVGRPLRRSLHLDFTLVYHRDRVLSPVLASFLALLPKRRSGRSLSRRREATGRRKDSKSL